MITTEKAIEILENKITELNKISDTEDFPVWQNTTAMSLEKIFGNNEAIEAFKEIEASYWAVDSIIYQLDRAKRDSTNYLTTFIQEVKDFGAKKSERKSTKGGIEINLTQSNNQTQSVTVSLNIVFEALKDELRKSEIEELLEILNQEVDEKEKKKSFMEKIKSFGADVSSNVLATILTNPQVFEQLGGLLGK